MNKIIIFFALLAILIVACENAPSQTQEKNKLSCSIDTDCICGGFDEKDNSCFLGNNEYYEKYVNKERQCPDFCGGIASNLVVKCINNQCAQVNKNLECTSDADCTTGGCSGTICQSKNTEPIFTTCEYLPEYACYKQINCACIDTKCQWDKTEAFDKCVEEARKSNFETTT